MSPLPTRSLDALYTPVWVLSLVHMATAVSTIVVYEIEDARDSQVIAILYSLLTFYMVHLLIPYTLWRDNDPVSRLNKQFVIVNFLVLCWVLSIALVPLTVGPGVGLALAECAGRMFFAPSCITLGLDVVIPFVLIGLLVTLSWRIYHAAQLIHQLQAQEHVAAADAESALPPHSPSALLSPSAPSAAIPPYSDADASPATPSPPHAPRQPRRGRPPPLISLTDV
ncbi:hypothetical protein HMN09_01392600 [Mycena chlorophos]|uniref:Transmembrane protein n=1 Tax=Mycena chlorophos TaxID=658473 RepID=A0A8H6RXW7_MYCCL|nr:hypothetical protein HMN09_01392600 [Mycena chlorophos]